MYLSGRDEAQNKMLALKERSDKDMAQQEIEMKELQRIIQHDNKLKEFMGIKIHDRADLKEEEQAKKLKGKGKWASAWDFQQYGILASVDSSEPPQPPFKLRNSKWCPFSSLTIIEYSSDLRRLWSDCAYAQADLRLCWSHISHCWKSHATAQMLIS